MKYCSICKPKTRPKSWKGYKFLLASGLAFSLMSICVKQLAGRLPISEIILTRSLISILITRLMINRLQINPWGKNKSLLLIRGLLGTSALFCVFKALQELPLASATIIQYTYPTFTVLAAWLFLKEVVQPQIIIAVFLGWAGISLVAQPSFNDGNISYLSIVIAVFGALLTSLAYVCVRKLSKLEHPLVIVHYFPLVSIPITIPFILREGILPLGVEWLWLLGVGIFTQIGQVWITNGLKLIPAAKASAINYIQVFFASTWGLIFFNEQLNIRIIIGSLLVLGSIIISLASTKESDLVNKLT